MTALAGRVAVVTGASRGAGRGIALALGEAGATVYVAARTRRGGPAPADGAPGTVDETAESVTAQGGRGVAVACDATRPGEVQALFARVQEEQGRLDLLVNAAWGGNESYRVVGETHTFEGTVAFDAPFWDQSLTRWDEMITAGVWPTVLASRFAAPLLVRQKRGLIVHVTDGIAPRYRGNLYWDLSHEAINRLAHAMAEELRPHGVACLAITPGFMRTERVLRHLGTDEAGWHRLPLLKDSETPQYVGRAIAALAADPAVLERSGSLLSSGDVAKEYGLKDVDGRYVPRHPAV
jgi:NAD(P)-dependent dehydrogenase (short-subunit alcohol dehydrogenase family)